MAPVQDQGQQRRTGRLWDSVAASRVLHKGQVDALRGIAVQRWDRERVVLAPPTATDFERACAYRRDLQRFLAQIGELGCVVEELPAPRVDAASAEGDADEGRRSA